MVVMGWWNKSFFSDEGAGEEVGMIGWCVESFIK